MTADSIAMTTADLVAQCDTSNMSEREDELVLHLIWSEWEGMPCLVSPAILEEARRATAEDAPHPPTNIGDVRRSGDLDQLEDLLDGYGASLEQYAAAIEMAAGLPVGGGDIAARLAALDAVDFAGFDAETDEYESLPADDHDFRDEQVAWGEPEVRYWDVISQATPNSLPSDLAERYVSDHYATGSPCSSGALIGSWADPARLDDLLAELEARGYVVHPRSSDIVNRESSGHWEAT